MNNSIWAFNESINLDNIMIIIILGAIAVIGVHWALERVLEKREIKEAKILSYIGTLVIVLTLATFYYACQNNSSMITATVTTILVVITGYYAWNTHLQVESMGDQIKEMRRQNDTMEKQFSLTDKKIKRDRISKEMDLLILPLETIKREIESIGIDKNWWRLQYKTVTETNPTTADRFRNAVNSIAQNKYLAPRILYPLIDDFIVRLRDMRQNDAEHQELLKKATENLYYGEGGLVEQRYHELTIELQALDNEEGTSPGRYIVR
jgi:hypothetical protein